MAVQSDLDRGDQPWQQQQEREEHQLPGLLHRLVSAARYGGTQVAPFTGMLLSRSPQMTDVSTAGRVSMKQKAETLISDQHL